MKKYLGISVIISCLCFLLQVSSNAQFDLNAIKDQAQKSIQNQTSPQDTGASSRDNYLKQQQASQANQEVENLASSCKVKLDSARDRISQNDMYSANDQLRLAGKNIEELKGKGYNTAALQSEYDELMQKANAVNQSAADAAGKEEIVKNYGFALFNEGSNAIDGISAMGGPSLSNSESFYKSFKAASEKKAAAEPYMAEARNNSQMASYIGYVDDFYKKLNTELGSGGSISSAIKDLVGKANKNQSLDDAAAAVKICEAVLLLDPENSAIKKMKPAADKALEKVGGAMGGADAVKNAGTIVFSKTPGGASSTSFTGNDFIYATVNFRKPYKDGEKYNAYLLVDNDYKVRREGFVLSKTAVGKSSNLAEVAPDPSTAKQQGGKLYTKALAELAEGMTYKVVLRYEEEYNSNSPISGEFDLDLSSGNGFAQRDKQFEANKISSTTMQKAVWSDPALEALIKKTFIKGAAGKGETPVRVVLVRDWDIHRNAITSVIEFRTIDADIAIKKDDGKYYVYEMTYQEPYLGNGKYGSLSYYSIGGTYEIPKENIFK